jgi:hypothetical protein
MERFGDGGPTSDPSALMTRTSSHVKGCARHTRTREHMIHHSPFTHRSKHMQSARLSRRRLFRTLLPLYP